MKCLFVFPNAPLSSNYSGGASRYLQSFLTLQRLGCDVHAVRLLDEAQRQRVARYEHDEAPYRAQAQSWRDLRYTLPSAAGNKGRRLRAALTHPAPYAMPEVVVLSELFQDAVAEVDPQFIWAEWTLSGALVAESEPGIPWIYAHHDWLHRVRKIRRRASGKTHWRDRLWTVSMRRLERQLIRKSTAVISGSTSEAQEIQALGGREVVVIPTTYDPIPPPPPACRAAHPPHLVHLGALSTTANYVGLLAYMETVHPVLRVLLQEAQLEMPFHVIGDAAGAKPRLLRCLEAASVSLPGHVDDLQQVFRPFDITIIPYQHDTGTRTKLPLLFNHAQVVVAMRAAVAGSAEVRPGENCVVVDALEAMPERLMKLARDPALRERIGRAAKATFDQYYTREAHLPKFERVLRQVGVRV